MPRLRAALLALLIIALPVCVPASGTNGQPTREQAEAYLEQEVAKLHPQHGTITIGQDLATLTIPPDFGYLPPDQTEILIHNIWQNPPGMKTLGAIIPADVKLLARDSWAAIIVYNDDGHVKDDDADTINYDELLQQMKTANREEAEKRKQEGYAAYDLAGWAEPPHYDKDTHKLYWAVTLKAEEGDAASLNYNIRILGRQGYLVMSLVGAPDQLAMLKHNAGTILSFVNFNATHRYADFNPATDKVAAYGMAAMVAGYAAAKVGLFKGLIVILIAFKKFLLLVALAVAGFFRKLFGRNRKK